MRGAAGGTGGRRSAGPTRPPSTRRPDTRGGSGSCSETSGLPLSSFAAARPRDRVVVAVTAAHGRVGILTDSRPHTGRLTRVASSFCRAPANSLRAGLAAPVPRRARRGWRRDLWWYAGVRRVLQNRDPRTVTLSPRISSRCLAGAGERAHDALGRFGFEPRLGRALSRSRRGAACGRSGRRPQVCQSACGGGRDRARRSTLGGCGASSGVAPSPVRGPCAR